MRLVGASVRGGCTGTTEGGDVTLGTVAHFVEAESRGEHHRSHQFPLQGECSPKHRRRKVVVETTIAPWWRVRTRAGDPLRFPLAVKHTHRERHGCTRVGRNGRRRAGGARGFEVEIGPHTNDARDCVGSLQSNGLLGVSAGSLPVDDVERLVREHEARIPQQ